jgi:hypothetical protein
MECIVVSAAKDLGKKTTLLHWILIRKSKDLCNPIPLEMEYIVVSAGKELGKKTTLCTGF